MRRRPVCSPAAAVGTTRARPSQHSQHSQHSQPAEPPPPAITPQPPTNQSLLQQQNGNSSSSTHLTLPQIPHMLLEGEFSFIVSLLSFPTDCHDVTLPHSCEREPIKGPFTRSR